MTKLCKDCKYCRPEFDTKVVGSLWWARVVKTPQYRFAKCAAPEANEERSDHLIAGEVYEPSGYCSLKRRELGGEKLTCGEVARWFVPLPREPQRERKEIK